MTNCSAIKRPNNRPRIDATDRRVPFGASIPAKLADAFDAMATKLGRTRSDLVREALEAALKAFNAPKQRN